MQAKRIVIVLIEIENYILIFKDHYIFSKSQTWMLFTITFQTLEKQSLNENRDWWQIQQTILLFKWKKEQVQRRKYL